jgi:hypothetical protein
MKWVLVLIAILFASPVLADESVRCVQQLLTDAGYDLGTVDGSFGGKTKKAGEDFLADGKTDLSLPPLSKETARQWCDALSPPVVTVAVLNRGAGVNDSRAQVLEEGLRNAEKFVLEVVGLTPREPLQVYMSNDAVWLTDNYLKANDLPNGFRKGKLESFGACNPSAEFGWYSIFLCTDAPEWDRGNAFSEGIVAHEYWHTVQADLVGLKAKTCCRDNDAMSVHGPEWLKEGSAQFIHNAMVDWLGWGDLQQKITSLVHEFRSSGLNLLDRNTRKGYREEGRDYSEDMGVVATYLLVKNNGYGSLVTFYRQLGYGASVDDAFFLAFKVTMKDFEKQFVEFAQNV